MTLYLLGFGFSENHINEGIKNSIKDLNKLYIDSYTNKIFYNNIKDLILDLNKDLKLIIANRSILENIDSIVDEAKHKNIGIGVFGDPLCATTHNIYILECLNKGINYKIINNVSVFNAIANTGLQVYKFGKTISIPFKDKVNADLKEKILDNLKIQAHTLFLLDLEPEKDRFMTIKEASEILNEIKEINKKEFLVCESLGTNYERFYYGTLNKLSKLKIKNYPICIILPGKLHFIEEDFLKYYTMF